MKIGPFDIWPTTEGYIFVGEGGDGEEYQLTEAEMFQLGAAVTQQAQAMEARREEEEAEE